MAKKKLDKDMIKSVSGGIDLTGLNVITYKLSENDATHVGRVNNARLLAFQNEAAAKFGQDNFMEVYNRDTKELYYMSIADYEKFIERM